MNPRSVLLIHPFAFVLDPSGVAKLLEQGFRLVAIAVNVADDVKWAVFLPFVVPERRSFDSGGIDLQGDFQHKNVAISFFRRATERLAKLRVLLMDDMRAKVPLAPSNVAILAKAFGKVLQDDHAARPHGETVIAKTARITGWIGRP